MRFVQFFYQKANIARTDPPKKQLGNDSGRAGHERFLSHCAILTCVMFITHRCLTYDGNIYRTDPPINYYCYHDNFTRDIKAICLTLLLLIVTIIKLFYSLNCSDHRSHCYHSLTLVSDYPFSTRDRSPCYRLLLYHSPDSVWVIWIFFCYDRRQCSIALYRECMRHAILL